MFKDSYTNHLHDMLAQEKINKAQNPILHECLTVIDQQLTNNQDLKYWNGKTEVNDYYDDGMDDFDDDFYNDRYYDEYGLDLEEQEY